MLERIVENFVICADLLYKFDIDCIKCFVSIIYMHIAPFLDEKIKLRSFLLSTTRTGHTMQEDVVF